MILDEPCKFCSNLTDPVRYYQQDYPHILLGPWCDSCISQGIKVCSQCQEDHLASESTKVAEYTWLCRRCYETYRNP